MGVGKEELLGLRWDRMEIRMRMRAEMDAKIRGNEHFRWI